ncbi:MAG: lipopolysaccharide assembly protein LapB [Gammaproteobacteria bacterium]|nr:lipopolysaccharide assembly protein LapB [Gammaproteobacteria bacterium]
MLLSSLLFLLLPVAALSGWYMGRREKPPEKDVNLKTTSPTYLKGLNFLLNEQPDKAIDVFIQLLEVDSETIETHLALGSLFRRRGEVDRAIRIHQNLIARPTLNKEQRSQALFELGQDYLRAGLLDRAEALFSELITSNPHTEAALLYLIDIYQQEKDWEKAIEMSRRLEVKSGHKQFTQIAHYYCELAELARAEGDRSRAMKLIKRALNSDSKSVRASLLEGEAYMSDENYKQAIKSFRRIEQQDINYLPEAISRLSDCYSRTGKQDEMSAYLQQLYARHKGTPIILAMTNLVEDQQGDDKAIEFITSSIKNAPTVRAMDRLIELNIRNTEGVEKEKLLVLKEITGKLLDAKPIYQCHICGFSSKQLYWQCPSCRNWDAIKPIHDLEGE